jgi:DNA repair exonuclease SbcCD nuclease subunit
MNLNSTTKFPLRQHLPLRFIHSSGLFLDRVIEHIPEMPAVFESRFFDVSRRAALRLFDKALEESVDFLIISGDILNASAAPPGLFVFLIEQFERLHKSGISVYWAGAELDSPDDIPISFPFPDNVHHFPTNSIQEYYFKRKNEHTSGTLAKIVGISRKQHQRKIRSSEFPIDPGRLFTIAIANGDVDPESLSQRRIDYWAMGGLEQRFIYQGNPRKKNTDGKPIPLDPPNLSDGSKLNKKDTPPPPFTVHYPGTTVALTPEMIGLYGATLVEVIPDEEPQLSFFQTSPIRWINDQITLNENDGIEQLKEEINSRIKNYQTTQKNEDLMISWFVDFPLSNQLSAILRKESAVNEILSELRKEYLQYRQNEPITWSVNITLLLPDTLPKQIYEQQTILGDFVRAIKHHQNEQNKIIDLTKYLPSKLKEIKPEENNSNEYGDILLANKTVDPNTGEVNLVQNAEQIKQKQEALKKAAIIATELLNKENSTQFTINIKNNRNEN